jgi:hypothetical protein
MYYRRRRCYSGRMGDQDTAVAVRTKAVTKGGLRLNVFPPLQRAACSLTRRPRSDAGSSFPLLRQNKFHLWFTAPPFVIFNVLEQISHDAVLPMPKTECFHTRSL